MFFNPLKWTEEALPSGQSFVDWVYGHRTAWWLWVVFLGLTGAAFVSAFALSLSFAGRYLEGLGPWLLIVLVTLLPFSFLVWVVRDRGRAEELRIRVSDHAQQVFEKLQEWTNGSNPTLQAAAIHQLRPFIFGEAGGLIPRELTGPHNPFAQPGMEILRALLDDRRWLLEWNARLESSRTEPVGPRPIEGMAPRSPVLRAIESILRSDNLPYRDFSNWNLSGLDLRHARLNHGNFTNTNLESTDFSESTLVGAVFVGAQMKNAIFNDAHLESANLSHSSEQYLPYHTTNLENVRFVNAHLASANLQWSHLKDSKFMFSNLEGANFSYSELNGADFFKANLEDVNFMGARLHNAKIDREWQGIFDWISLEIEGEPDIV